MNESNGGDAFDADFLRATGQPWKGSVKQTLTVLMRHELGYLFVHRKLQKHAKPACLWRLFRHRLKRKYGLEIDSQDIGPGLKIVHPYNITINPKAHIGADCTIHKGATIGQENRGARKGAPTIGDRVWIGINATVVGKITIGDNVLIAPNAFVNQSVPSNSIAIGCPCKVLTERPEATKNYL